VEKKPMNVAIDLPDDIVQQLEMKWPDVPRGVVEAIAVEGYRSGALTHGQVERLLRLSWMETEVFLKERQAYLHYDEADLAQDRATLDRLLPK
jgi:predicted HTH domain antitoxin